MAEGSTGFRKAVDQVVHSAGYLRSFLLRPTFPLEGYQIRRNCLFIHIPKVAGTSILHALGKSGTYGRNHLPWYVYHRADPWYFNHAFKFAFVRNPYDRVYSAYEYLRSGGNRRSEDAVVSRLVGSFSGFDDFVIGCLGQGRLRSNIMFVPQSNFIVGSAGEVVVDFVGRYESLESDFAYITSKLGLASQSLIHKNATAKRTHGDHRQAYRGSEARRIVMDLYLQDLELFGYGFD